MENIKRNSQGLIDISINGLLSHFVDRYPGKIFFKYGEKEFTWEMIDKYSQIIAKDLSDMGIKKGSHVGLCGANSANWVFTFFALHNLGAVACLLNFNYKEKELCDVSLIGDIDVVCIGEVPQKLDTQSLIEEKESNIKQVYILDNDTDFASRLSEYEGIKTLFREDYDSDDVSIMIYTSGSTGKPKGVLLSAYNVLNAADSRGGAILQNEKDKLCLILPLFHIFGLTSGFFSNALYGGQIVIPTAIKTDILIDIIEKEKCTLFHSVPTMAIAIMNNKNYTPEKLASLRCTILAGGATTRAQMEKMTGELPNVHFMVSYGLSEMSPVSITDYDDSMEHRCTTAGKPLKHIRLRITDPATGENLPINKAGEVLVRGYNLTCGYYKRGADDQSIDEEGWLHTGDLGFLDDEGYLHITGRAKELIIRGGENIMPNEVAGAISAYEGIVDAKVVGVPDDFYGEAVCSCIVLKDKDSFKEDDLREFLLARIAKYKVPKYFLIYDELPKLANGKPDMVNIKKDAERRVVEL